MYVFARSDPHTYTRTLSLSHTRLYLNVSKLVHMYFHTCVCFSSQPFPTHIHVQARAHTVLVLGKWKSFYIYFIVHYVVYIRFFTLPIWLCKENEHEYANLLAEEEEKSAFVYWLLLLTLYPFSFSFVCEKNKHNHGYIKSWSKRRILHYMLLAFWQKMTNELLVFLHFRLRL